MIPVTVVLDLASYAWRLGELTSPSGGGLFRYPELVRVPTMLERHGLATTRLAVAAPVVALRLGVDDDVDRTRDLTRRTRKWWRAQQRAWGNSGVQATLDLLPGGLHAVREVGVDTLVASEALHESMLIARDKHTAEAVVICSHDGDFHELHRSLRSPTIYAGAFNDDELRSLQRSAGFPVRISDAAFSSLSPDRPSSEDRTAGMIPALPPAATGDPGGMSGARTVAVLDPYGLSQSVSKALGVARLPTAESTRSLVESLGWDHPIAVYATVPDVLLQQVPARAAELSGADDSPARNIEEELRAAWSLRDSALDLLHDQFMNDDDPSSESRRAVLHPRRATYDSRERDLAATAVKRLSTGLVADIAGAASADRAIVVLSEDVDVAWAIDSVRAIHPGWWAAITRIGVHATRYEVAEDPHEVQTQLDPAPFITLTEQQCAALCGVIDQPFGRRLRSAISSALDHSSDWELVGRDAETGAHVVRTRLTGDAADPPGIDPDELGWIEARLFVDDLDVAPVLEAGELRTEVGFVRLEFSVDPERPCAHPDLTLTTAGFVIPEHGQIVHVAPHEVAVDVDGDGSADLTVNPGHTAARYEPRTAVGVRRTADGTWMLVEIGTGLPDPPEPEPLLVTGQLTDGRITVVPLEHTIDGGSEAATGVGTPPPGLRSVLAPTGSVVIGVRSSSSGREGDWTVLSSGLPHLAALLD